MRVIVLAAAVSLFATAASAQAWSGFNQYVSLSGGAAGSGEFSYDYIDGRGRNDVSLSDGTSAQLAFGTRAGNWRVEAALSQRNQEATAVRSFQPSGVVYHTITVDAAVRAIDLNGYFDFPTGSMVRPYVGAGLGLAQTDFTGIVEDAESTLQLQAIGGVSADISPRVALFAEARFQRAGDVGLRTQFPVIDPGTGQVVEILEGEDEFSFTTTQLAAGVRFSF